MSHSAVTVSGIDIHVGSMQDPQKVLELLATAEPTFKFFHWNLAGGEPIPAAYSPTASHDILVWIEASPDPSDFPMKIALETPHHPQRQTFFINLCQKLSVALDTRCFCGVSKTPSTASPYLSVLFDQGAGFWVNDANWEDKQELVILGPYSPEPSNSSD